jgi:hypothetical protein
MDWLPGIVGGALAGAGSGLLAALVARWAEWGIEQRRYTRDRRAAAITQRRASIRDLRAAESGYLARKAEDEKTGLLEAPVPPEVDLAQRVWFPTLEVELSDEAAEYLERLRRLQIEARQGEVPDLLARQLTSAFLV